MMWRGLAVSIGLHAAIAAGLAWLGIGARRRGDEGRQGAMTMTVEVVEVPAGAEGPQSEQAPESAGAPALPAVRATTTEAKPATRRAVVAMRGGDRAGVDGSTGTLLGGGVAGAEGSEPGGTLGPPGEGDASKLGPTLPSTREVAARYEAAHWAPFMPGAMPEPPPIRREEIPPPTFGPCLRCVPPELIAWAKNPGRYYIEQGEDLPPGAPPVMKTPIGAMVKPGLSLADVGVDPTFDAGTVVTLPLVTGRFGSTGRPKRGVRLESTPDPGRALAALPERLDALARDGGFAEDELRQLFVDLWSECRDDELGLEARRIIEEAARRRFPDWDLGAEASARSTRENRR